MEDNEFKEPPKSIDDLQLDMSLETHGMNMPNVEWDMSADSGIWMISDVYEDVMVVRMVDKEENGYRMVDGLYINTTMKDQKKVWRKAEVILVGNGVKHTKVGDVVLFNENAGFDLANVDVAGFGVQKSVRLVSEERLIAKLSK